MARITRFALDHGGLTLIVSLVLFLAGLAAFFSLNQELIPSIEFPAATVVTVWPGASADEVTRSVTRPIEDALEEIDDVAVENVSSRTSGSFSAVTLTSELGTTQEEMREAIEKQLASVDLPEDAEDPEVLLFDFGDIPVVSMSVRGDMPENELLSKVNERVVPDLESIEGVAEVSVSGAQDDKLIVTLDPAAMAAAGVTLDAIRGVLAANNLSLPAGNLTSPGESIPLLVTNLLRNEDDLRQLVVAPAGAGAMAGMPGGSGMPQLPPEAAGEEVVGEDEAPPSDAAQEPEDDEQVAKTMIVVVKSGDTVTGIADRFGVDADAIRDANELTGDELEPGTLLRVPQLAVGSDLPPLWQALGAETAAEITPELLQLAISTAPEAVNDLTDEQLLAMPVETLRVLPLTFLLRLPDDLRERINDRLSGAEAALQAAGRPRLMAPVRQEAPITLGDIATIERAPDEAQSISRTDGQPSLAVDVLKEQTANTVNVVAEVETILEELEEERELGIDFNVVFEQKSYIEDSLNAVRNEGILGAIFAILVIFVFLNFSVRATLVTAISIPLSLVFAFLLMKMMGLTLNLLTLSGLTVSVGRIVDDAIVVTENVYRHLQRGDPREDSVFSGTKEVTTAITASTLVAVAVFLPLGFIGGITREFFGPFGLTVTFALLASLAVAVTVVPVLAKKLMKRPAEPEDEDQLDFLQRLYVPSLDWALDHRWITLILAGLFFLVSLAAASFVPKTFLPSFGEPALTVDMALPPGTNLQTTDRVSQRVEQLLMDDEGVETIEASIGGSSASIMQAEGGNTARAFFFATFASQDEDFLDRFSDDEVVPEDVAERMRRLLPSVAADEGIPITFTVSSGAMAGMNGNAYDLQILADDEEQLKEVNDLVLAALLDPESWEERESARERIFGVDEDAPPIPIINLTSNLSEARDVLSVEVDPAKAIARGLTTAQVGFALRQVLEGQDLGTVELESEGETETLDIVARYPDETIGSKDMLADFEIVGPAGPVRLGDIATIETKPGPVEIARVDGRRAAILTGEITDDDTFGVIAEADAIIEDLDLDSTYDEDEIEIGAGVESSQQMEGFNDLIIAILISIVIVYAIMAVTFRSFVHPFTILFSIPFAISGALIALALTGRPLSISSLIGILMLIGIVTTNAIVLIDLVRQYQKERGMQAHEALMRGGRVRLRPILMTAIATILALIPMALEISGEGGIIASDLATAVIGGLLTSTLLTLIIVPVVYSLLDRLSTRGDATEGEPPPETSGDVPDPNAPAEPDAPAAPDTPAPPPEAPEPPVAPEPSQPDDASAPYAPPEPA